MQSLALLLLSLASSAHAQVWSHAADVVVLQGGDASHGERRGSSVACSGDGQRVIVGSNGRGAWIFAHEAGVWTLEHHVLGNPHTGVGTSVAMSADGHVALIGAPNTYGVGAVHVIVRDDFRWMAQATLEPSDGQRGDGFGRALAISRDGSVALVGVPRDDTSENDTGSARLWTLERGAWHEGATLLASDAARGDALGSSVALSADGGVAWVGAPRDDVAGHDDAGSAHAFTGVAGWRETYVSPVPLERLDLFGSSVAISPDGITVMVGAPGDDVDGRQDVGSVYFGELRGGAWREVDHLIGAVDEGGRFGESVAISDVGVAIVGAPHAGDITGRALWFAWNGAAWTPAGAMSASAGTRGDLLGTSVAISDDGARGVAGAPGDQVDRWRNEGSARAFSIVPGAAPRVAGERLDAATHAQLGDAPRRSHEEESRIRTGGTVAMVLGGMGIVGGAIAVIAGTLRGYDFSSGAGEGDPILEGFGGVLIVLGAISLVAGGAEYSRREQGHRIALAPTWGGLYGTLTLRF